MPCAAAVGRLIQGKCKSGKHGLHDLFFRSLPPSPAPCHTQCKSLSQGLTDDGCPSLSEGIRPSEGASRVAFTGAGYTLGGGAGGDGGGVRFSGSPEANDVEQQILQQVLLQSWRESKQQSTCLRGCGRFATPPHNTCCRGCAMGGKCSCDGEGDSATPIICVDSDSDDEAACSKSSTAKRSMPAGAADASAQLDLKKARP
jgi:hypothetical protein